MTSKSHRIHVDGTVQGVGFRPFIWSLAKELRLSGWVRNSSSGVDIRIEGPDAAVDHFESALRHGGPPLARVDSIAVETCPPESRAGFAIVESKSEAGESLPVAADVATCNDCLREMQDPSDRRYRYPFINCTQCGPRFSIVRSIPYDRSRTTMAGFPMCDDCVQEYEDPADRRFHAQPVACHHCGPQLWLEHSGSDAAIARGEAALMQARQCLLDGRILAIKGLGGFHLACDATNEQAVARLRRRKHRDAKPLGLMVADVAAIASYAELSQAARELLESVERPLLLLPRRTASAIADAVAPGRHHLGFMLPYTPLHHLLLHDASLAGYSMPLVMTSANLSDEPIIHDNRSARARLADVADELLVHDRDIHMRNDDSVATEFRGRLYFHRRSRGFAPRPLSLPFATDRSLLAVGAELKNAFCLVHNNRAFVSHHIGDLEQFETVSAFESSVTHYERLFCITPQIVVHDLHPDYHSTRYAERRAREAGLQKMAVQHHHAHVAACMADNDLGRDEKVIGVAFDGSGFGTDAAIWGGEFLLAGYADFERATHLRYWPLPGGDAAVRKPYRIALSLLRQASIPWNADLPPVAASTAEERTILEKQLQMKLNSPPTSSMGRLFDAVASLVGLCQEAQYEAQAASELEAAAWRADSAANDTYQFAIGKHDIDAAPVLQAIAADIATGVPVTHMAWRFHVAVSAMVLAVCLQLRNDTDIHQVALSGGVWQNQLLLRNTVRALEDERFVVLVHRNVPANDGGLALGQAVVAACQLETPS